MKEFEDHKYSIWIETVENLLPGYLKRNLLTKASPPPTAGNVEAWTVEESS